jgi:hypothetical protein
MWRQFLGLPGFRGVTGNRVTALHFPSPERSNQTSRQRVDELARWEERLQCSDARLELERGAGAAARRVAVAYHAHAYYLEQLRTSTERALALATEEGRALQQELVDIRATRTWRVRNALLRIRPLRALLARSNAAR